MYLAQISFGAHRDISSSKDEIEELLEGYVGSLAKEGQLLGDYMFSWNREKLEVYAYLAHQDALEEKYHSEEGMEFLKGLHERFHKLPKWLMLDDDTRKALPPWEDATGLFLFTHAYDKSSPICRLDNGHPVPQFLLPISPELREQLYFWSEAYKNHDRLWLSSSALEMEAYSQLACADSELAKQGREICKKIEEGCKKPVYLYLMRHWGRSEDEPQRKCPVCQEEWKAKGTTESTEAFYAFDYLCEPCRLVSHRCKEVDSDKASIGEVVRSTD